MELHPQTEKLVTDFANALRQKLIKAQQEHGFQDDWRTVDWRQECQDALLEHVFKGDPLDVAAYAAFCWGRGWATSVRAE
jgi:hypothetical protein